ncbi:MAG: hypothetical protein GF400_06595, partial [Candidatus Eisenbacteria bacterium]|nr:hypothetical protein [Candidatus Eisenbacteria bacterium]
MVTRTATRSGRRWRPAVALAVGLLAALAAAAGAADYVLLIDSTGTMRYHGKAEATLSAVGDFIESTRPGDFVTVYGYGEDPYAALPERPARVDCEGTREMLSENLSLAFGADRTDITRGLDLVWQERNLVLPRAATRDRAGGGEGSCVVLLTDGKLIPCYDDYSKYDQIYAASRERLVELGKLFGEAGVPVYAVGLGAAEDVDGSLLEDIAWESGGSYLHAPTSADVSRAFHEIVADVMGVGAICDSEGELLEEFSADLDRSATADAPDDVDRAAIADASADHDKAARAEASADLDRLASGTASAEAGPPQAGHPPTGNRPEAGDQARV